MMAGEIAGKRVRSVRPVISVLLTLAVLLPASVKAETTEQDFLQVAPLPEGIEAVEPIPGAVNDRFQDCVAVWPEGYRAWLSESAATEGHAERGDIYGWLRTKQAFEGKACDCSAKVAPWDEVNAIYAALQAQHGRVVLKHTAIYEEQARAYRAAVEWICGGPF
jgi:hypothetical protein